VPFFPQIDPMRPIEGQEAKLLKSLILIKNMRVVRPLEYKYDFQDWLFTRRSICKRTAGLFVKIMMKA